MAIQSNSPAPNWYGKIVNLFPEIDTDTIRATVERYWQLDGPLPTPLGHWLECPVCRSSLIQLKQIYISHREEGAYRRGNPGEHRYDFRATPTFKCCTCSMFWDHGIPITEAEARRYGWNGKAILYQWREARLRLKNDRTLQPS